MGRSSSGNVSKDARAVQLTMTEKSLTRQLHGMEAAQEILQATGKLPPPENVYLGDILGKPGQIALACEASPKSPLCPGRSFEVHMVKVGERAAFVCHPCYRMFERLHREQMVGPYGTRS